MELYNCYSPVEKELKNTDLTTLPDGALMALAVNIHEMYCHKEQARRMNI